jgi:ABC-type Fe3+ transport system permease subunit
MNIIKKVILGILCGNKDKNISKERIGFIIGIEITVFAMGIYSLIVHVIVRMNHISSLPFNILMLLMSALIVSYFYNKIKSSDYIDKTREEIKDWSVQQCNKASYKALFYMILFVAMVPIYVIVFCSIVDPLI